ncbi:NAD(P)-binding protein [Nonomuraea antimicrobica]
MRVIIVGAGVAGLALARAVLAAGHDAEVYEEAPSCVRPAAPSPSGPAARRFSRSSGPTTPASGGGWRPWSRGPRTGGAC